MEKLIFLFFLFNSLCLFSLDSESTFRRLLARAIAEPSVFLREIKSDSEITVPVRPGYNWALNYAIFPTFFPFVFVSPSFSTKLYMESSIPQIDFFAGFQYFAASSAFMNSTDDVEDMSFWGFHGGFLMSNSLASKVRNFYGLKYSYSDAKLKLSKDKKHELLGVEINSFNFSDSTVYAVFGVEVMRDIEKYFAIQINYDFKNNNVFMKTGWYGKWFELGLNFYPDGILSIHPIWNMRLNF